VAHEPIHFNIINHSTNISFAIVGCGNIAQRHAQHIAQQAKLVAVCDVVKEKADALAKEFGVNAYASLEEMLTNEKELDVVSICTPNGLHAIHSITCLQNGKHVLCEKPMAINSIDCQAMMAAAEKANKQLFVVKQNRYNPPVAALKQALDENKLGKIFSVQLNCFWNRNDAYYANSWKGTKDLDGGTLFTQFSHFIDLLNWLFGDLTSIHALADNFNHQGVIEFEDTGIVAFRFQQGTLGSIHYTVNAHKQNMEGSLTIFAEKGTVKIGGQYLNELSYQSIDGFSFPALPQGNLANNYTHYQGSMSNHDKVYHDVIACLQTGKAPDTSLHDAMQTVNIIERIYASAKMNA
jgi:UDP-N-acetyl-2-amino-2-deoxyglucuronate dehydrogenase